MTDPVASSAASARRLWPRLLLLAGLAGAVTIVAVRYGELLSLESLAAQEASLLGLAREHTAAVVAGLFVLYVVVTGSSLPFATALTFLVAWMFRRLFDPLPGFAAAVLLVSFAGTAGATVAFLLSRYLLLDVVRRRYAGRLGRFDESLRRDGSFYLFTLRLTPVVPFWLVNLAMGLTPLRARTFWWVSQLGMLPGTCVFVFAGRQVPSLADLEDRGVWDILWPGPVVALVLLAAFPWFARWAAERFRGEPRVGAALPDGRG